LGELYVTDARTQAPLGTETEPRGDLCIRTLAMPADTNANGDIFGGWLPSQMDIGGGVFASKIATPHRDGGDRGDEFSKARLCRRSRLCACQSGAGRPHLDHGAPRSVGPAPQGDGVDPGHGWQFTYVSIDDHGRPQALRPDAPITT
jgi:acyl-CoA thioesterase YciA